MMKENKQENEKRATIADIVAEMRRREKSHYYQKVARNIMHQYADRIEAAWKRETSQSWHHREMEELILRHEKEVAELKKQIGNAAAMREALESARNWCLNRLGNASYQVTVEWLLSTINAALSLPPRQCDVGTPEEQRARFHRFCENGQHTDKACCGGCPIVVEGFREKVGVSCELEWAQMPYEADEKGEGDGR